MLRFLKYSVLSLAVLGLMTLPSYAQVGSGNNSHQTVLVASSQHDQLHTGAAASTTQASTTSVLDNGQNTPCSYAYSQAYGDCESNVKANATSSSTLRGGGGAGGH